MSDIIQRDYEQLEAIARRFERKAASSAATLKRLRERTEVLRGSWEGSASARFQAEMGGEVLPAVQRLAEGRAVWPARAKGLESGLAYPRPSRFFAHDRPSRARRPGCSRHRARPRALRAC